jgi:hypothetical protein
MRTFWIYHSGRPVHAVRLPAGATESEIKSKAAGELDRLPGVFCEPLEAPFEHALKIQWGEIKTFESERG